MSTSKPRLENIIMTAGLGVTVALAVLALVVLFPAIDRQRAAGAAVIRTYQTISAGDRLLQNMLDAETGQRGFLITGLESYLEPYRSARWKAGQRLDNLRDLLLAEPEEEAAIARVDSLAAARFAQLDSVIVSRRQRRRAAATDLVLTGSGMRIMDELRAGLGGIEARETARLEQRTAFWNARRDANRRFLAWLAALMVIQGVGLFLALMRQVRASRKAEEERERIITLSEDLFCVAGFDGRFTMVNPAWERTLGHPLEELLSRPFVEFIHPDDVARTNEEYEQQTKAGKLVIDFENRYRHRDGSYRWFQWRAITRWEEGVIYAVVRDITDKKAHELSIRELNARLEGSVRELEAVNQELEAFTYSVSHDLRAPLRHIGGFTNLLAKRHAPAFDETGRRYMDTIRQSAVQMGALIDDLLTFSRLSRQELHVEDVRLGDVAEAVVAAHRDQVRDREVRIAVRPLPVARGDRALLGIALANLIGNAVKYTRTRAESLIEVGTEPGRQGEVAIFVRDNGVGFDMRYADKLFGVFQRLHNADEFEGTGIGLATVKRIVQRHRGRVWAEGEVDRGATFYVALPAAGVAEGVS